MSQRGIKAGRAYVEIGSDLRGLERGLKKATKMVSGFGKGMATVGAAMSGIGVAAGAALTPAIKAAATWENTIFRANQIFGDGAAAQIRWADDTAKQYGRSRNEVLNFITSVSLMYKNLGVEAEKSNRIAKTLAERALLFANVSGTTATEMMTRFIRALSGSAEVLDQFGVNLKEARLKSIQELMGYKPSEMNEYSKALARYTGLLEDTAVALNAADPGTFIDKQQTLNSEIERFSEELGGSMLESLGAVLQAFNGLVQSGADAAGGFKNLGAAVVGSIAGLAIVGLALKIVGFGLMSAAAIGSRTVDVFGRLTRLFAGIGKGAIVSGKAIKKFVEEAAPLTKRRFLEGYFSQSKTFLEQRRFADVIPPRPIVSGKEMARPLIEFNKQLKIADQLSVKTGRQVKFLLSLTERMARRSSSTRMLGQLIGPMQAARAPLIGPMPSSRVPLQGPLRASTVWQKSTKEGVKNVIKSFGEITKVGELSFARVGKSALSALGKGSPAALAIETMFITFDTGFNSVINLMDLFKRAGSSMADVLENMSTYGDILGGGGERAEKLLSNLSGRIKLVLGEAMLTVVDSFRQALADSITGILDLLFNGLRDLKSWLVDLTDIPFIKTLNDFVNMSLGPRWDMSGLNEFIAGDASSRKDLFDTMMSAGSRGAGKLADEERAEQERVAKLYRDRAENEARRQAVIDRTKAKKEKAKEVSEQKKEDRKITEKYGQEFTEAFRKKEADAGKKPTAMERAKMMYDENMSKRRAWEEKRRSLQERLTSIKENKPDVSRAIASLGSQVAQKQIRQNKDVQKQIRDYNKDTADATKEIAEHMKKKGAAYSL